MIDDPRIPAMPHPLVTQLRFTRDEFVRGLTGLTDEEACRTPPLEDMWTAWRAVTRASEPRLDVLTIERLRAPMAEGLSSVWTFLRRTTYHYWYHLGEALAARQMLGHRNLPDCVGDIDALAPYRPE
jgi:hypothetical protein